MSEEYLGPPQSDEYKGTPEERTEALKEMVLRDFEVQVRLQSIIMDLRIERSRRWLWYAVLFLAGVLWRSVACS